MKRVMVLMGGVSVERDVSLASGRACAEALREAGYAVSTFDVGHDVAALVAALTPAPDVVFNALHGRFGEDGCVQGLLELMGIAYTHSGVQASAIAMDKAAARTVFAAHGLPCADGRVVPVDQVHDVFEAPYVVKPVREGSSVGVLIVRPGDNAEPFGGRWDFGAEALVERFVPGRELTVAVMEDRALGVLEIVPRERFYDYDSKYAPGGSEHIVPAAIHADVYAEAERIALEAHRALGCRGVTRADLRYDDTAGEPGHLCLLEVNTQPGMTATSLVPDIARHAGFSFPALVAWMVEAARCDA